MREGVEREETEREKTGWGGEEEEGRWCFNAIPAGSGWRTHKPISDSFLKRRNSIVPCSHLSIRPRCPSPSTRLFTPKEVLALEVCLVTLNNAHSTSALCLALGRTITPLPLPAVQLFLQSLSLNLLSLCVAVIYANAISLSSFLPHPSIPFRDFLTLLIILRSFSEP